jgi:hypothetical protein
MVEWMYRSTFVLISELVGGEWSASLPGRLTPREKVPGILWIAGWVNPSAGLNDVKKTKSLTLPGLELRTLRSSVAILTTLSPMMVDSQAIIDFLVKKERRLAPKRRE